MLERLDHWSGLALIRGPIGSGKTTLAAQWASEALEAGDRVVWVDCSAPPQRVLLDALSAVTGTEIPPDVTFDEALASLTVVLRDSEQRIAVVGDNFDQSADALGEVVVKLLEKCPRLHVVLLMRAHHNLIWSAIVSGDHRVIGLDELAMNTDELHEYASLRGARLEKEQAEEIIEQTGGMASFIEAGLVQESVDGVGEAWWSEGSVHEVVANQVRRLAGDGGLGRFRALAHLDSIELSVIEKVLGARYEAAFTIYQSMGVVERHKGGDVRRVHRPPIVVEAVRRMSIVEDHEDDQAVIDQVTAELGRLDKFADAIDLAKRSGQFEALLELVEHRWADMALIDPQILADALAVVPAQTLQGRPPLVRYLARLSPDQIVGHEMPPELDITHRDEQLREIAAGPDALQLVDSLMLSLAATTARGNRAQAHELVRQGDLVIDELARAQSTEHWRATRRLFVRMGYVHLLERELDAAEKLLRRAYGATDLAGLGPMRREAANLMALVHVLRGDHASTLDWLSRADSLDVPQGWYAERVDFPRHLTVTMLAMDRLDRDEAARSLEALDRMAEGHELWFLLHEVHAVFALMWGGRLSALHDLQMARAERPHLVAAGSLAQAQLEVWEGNLLLSLGRGTEVEQVLSSMGASPRVRLVRALLLSVTGQVAEAHAVLASIIRTPHDLLRVRVEALLLSAQLRHEAGDRSTALALVTKAARHPGLVGCFAAMPRSILRAYVDDVPALGAIADALDAGGLLERFPAQIDVVTLTDRERQLLDLLPTVHSRAAMARSLFVSTNTVKTQLQGLYRKLGVTSREEAVSRAYELGLLG